MKRKKLAAAIVAIVSLAIAVFCAVYLYNYYREKQLSSSLPRSAAEEVSVVSEERDPVRMDVQLQEAEKQQNDAEEETENPISFAEWMELNSDVYAWITVPDTLIDFPVLQHPTDDRFYLSHGPDKKYYIHGSIFSEHLYNEKSWDESVIVLYGHDVYHGTEMFSQLNNLADAAYFDEHPEFWIYTPEKLYRYQIFAALPYSTERLLGRGIFDDEDRFFDFFSSLPRSYPFHSNYRVELFPEYGDQVVILSTCYTQNHKERFLVMGVCAEVQEVTNGEKAP